MEFPGEMVSYSEEKIIEEIMKALTHLFSQFAKNFSNFAVYICVYETIYMYKL
jgi:hypothetical protein